MPKTEAPANRPKGGSRMARTVRSLLLMALLGAFMACFNIYTNNRDVRLATGPAGDAQQEFFVSAADRPDMLIFFKSLTPAQRLNMSENIGRYDDPVLAKLVAKLLETFDTRAREALTRSMSALAKTHPKEVAEQLKVSGSFQQLAIQAALRQAGPAAYPLVADRLTDGDARPNAISFLVSEGPATVPSLLPMLQHKEKDVRLAAADALGKLRAKQAVPPLLALYSGSTGDEHYGYLAALAGIGDPSTEDLLASALKDESLPDPQRAQAALGLGRIASASAIRTLWSFAGAESHVLHQSAISALQVAGDPALRAGEGNERQKLEVAAGIRSPLADQVLRAALSGANGLFAAQSAGGRADLVAALANRLSAIEPDQQGDVADALVAALATTPDGKARLANLQQGPLAGLIQRRLSILGA